MCYEIKQITSLYNLIKRINQINFLKLSFFKPNKSNRLKRFINQRSMFIQHSHKLKKQFNKIRFEEIRYFKHLTKNEMNIASSYKCLQFLIDSVCAIKFKNCLLFNQTQVNKISTRLMTSTMKLLIMVKYKSTNNFN